jgi:hypothetical protein
MQTNSRSQQLKNIFLKKKKDAPVKSILKNN